MKMVRILSFLLVFLSTTSGIFAQDIIVTNTLDSIECKIIRISGDTLYISFLEGGVEKSKTFHRSKISSFAVDYKNAPEEIPPPAEPTYPKFRISFGGGIANLIGGIPNNTPQSLIPYTQELKSGNHFVADLCFYASEHIGVGIKYSMFKTSNSLKNVLIIDSSGATSFGLLEDNITVQYIGPALAIRSKLPSGSAHLISNLSLGLLTYENRATVVEKVNLTGAVFAFSGDIGLDFEIVGGLYFGVEFGLTLGMIKKLELETAGVSRTLDLSENEYSNPSRFDLGIGLRYFW